MVQRSVLVLSFVTVMGLLVSGCASEGTMGSSGTDGGTTSATTKNIDRIASGSVEDTLNACMARIPKDASAGQRMLAEESCKRDQASRR